MMHAFPPAPADQVTLANWRTGPHCKWAFHHVREIVPSAEIAHDPDRVWRLEDDLALLRVSVRPDGEPAPVGLTVPFPATGVDTRGWAVME